VAQCACRSAIEQSEITKNVRRCSSSNRRRHSALPQSGLQIGNTWSATLGPRLVGSDSSDPTLQPSVPTKVARIEFMTSTSVGHDT
jgi:hypothetical protein